ncbi:ABC transporter ATP-binding protein [Corynebacterium sp. S7]
MSSAGVLEAKGLEKKFNAGPQAVDGVSLTLDPGDRLALIGRSGSGKSTLLRMLLALEKPDAGEITYANRRIEPGTVRELRWYRREVQYIPQDPAGSLDPGLSVAQLITDPLKRLKVPGDHEEHLHRALEQVHLGPEFLHRRRSELSGGQAQRVAIARALATGASVLLADEPVSGLDLPLRDEVLELLNEISLLRGMSILMVTHDLGAARQLCSHGLVMFSGKVVESGEMDTLLSDPQHPETQLLIESLPKITSI